MPDSSKVPDDVDILHYPVGKSKTINGILKLLRRKWSVQISDNGKDEFLLSDESVILDLKTIKVKICVNGQERTANFVGYLDPPPGS